MNWTIFFTLFCFVGGLAQECGLTGDLGIEDMRVPNENMFASSESAYQRAAHFGRMGDSSGGNGWTAAISNTHQHLGVDLGGRRVVTGVATQGRRGSGEYVEEFRLEFSEDGDTWRPYLDEYGVPLHLIGNTDDNSIVSNTLSRPIVARYLRFHPIRWQQQISMRIEAYGCDFETTSASFDGQSYLTYQFPRSQDTVIESLSDRIKFRMRTWQADGVVLYAKGSQGDYVAIELLRGQLYYRYSLGRSPTDPGDNVARASSLLDDNQWHDVEILRERKHVTFIVDRVAWRDKSDGDFERLDIDKSIMIGGVDRFNYEGLSATRNFQGCLENFEFNHERMLEKAEEGNARYTPMGSVVYQCRAPTFTPVTIPETASFIKFLGTESDALRVRLQFRSYNSEGLLIYNKINTDGHIKLSINVVGAITVEVKLSNEGSIIAFDADNLDPASLDGTFTDGLWHDIRLDVTQREITFRADERGSTTEVPDGTVIRADPDVFIGGMGPTSGTVDQGFVGCVKNVEIDNTPQDMTSPTQNSGSIIGTCGMLDRCHPTPCLHKGRCTQTWKSFQCNCDETGYTGSTCTVSKYPLSCQDVRILLQQQKDDTTSGNYYIDLDGSGPLEALQVMCTFPKEAHEPARTQLFHNQKVITVQGYDPPGAKQDNFQYGADREQLNLLVSRSQSCYQEVSFYCRSARFLKSPGTQQQPGGREGPVITYSYWRGRTGQNQHFWGGSSPPTFNEAGMCGCGVQNTCERQNDPCNCDANLDKENVDSGKLTQQELLPVMSMHVGDTGTTVQSDKYVRYEIGELNCIGDKLFDSTVTFRRRDASIDYPNFFAELDKRAIKSEDRSSSTIDIYFQFKTTRRSGIILQAIGEESGHFLEVRLFDYKIIQFRFNVGNGIVTLERLASEVLNNDEWHTVHVERNRKQAVLEIDDQPPQYQDEPLDLGYRPLRLTSPLVIGSAVDYKNGFVGCLRAVVVNGNVLDIRERVDSGEVTYGVSPGCRGKCHSSPCLHGGICKELYDDYSCECTFTYYRGWICGREVGVNLKSGWFIRYDLADDQRVSTTDETMVVGFTTQKRGGILLQIVGEKDGNMEYISIEVTNNGGIRVTFDVGFGFGTLSIPMDIKDVELANNQQHIANVTRFDKGRKWSIKVDDYPGVIFDDSDNTYLPPGGLPQGADTRLDNIKYIYMGANDSVIENNQDPWMFQGCLFHVRFNELYPLKAGFFDPRPKFVHFFPNDSASKFREDMCGYEELLHPSEPAEIRPTPEQPRPTTAGSKTSASTRNLILGVVLAVLFIILVLAAFLIGRYVSRMRGDYATDEAKGANAATDADAAVSSNGQKKKEYFL